VTTLICKAITVTKSREVKTGCNLAESSKEGLCSNDDDDDDDDVFLVIAIRLS
jgi:hypothetical protein